MGTHLLGEASRPCLAERPHSGPTAEATRDHLVWPHACWCCVQWESVGTVSGSGTDLQGF